MSAQHAINTPGRRPTRTRVPTAKARGDNGLLTPGPSTKRPKSVSVNDSQWPQNAPSIHSTDDDNSDDLNTPFDAEETQVSPARPRTASNNEEIEEEEDNDEDEVDATQHRTQATVPIVQSSLPAPPSYQPPRRPLKQLPGMSKQPLQRQQR